MRPLHVVNNDDDELADTAAFIYSLQDKRRKQQTQRKQAKWLALVGILALAAAAVVWVFWPGSSAKKTTPSVPAVSRRPVKTPRHSPPVPPAVNQGGVVHGGQPAATGAASPPAASARLAGSPTRAAPSTGVNNSVHPSQQSPGATQAPAATPSPTPTPLLDSVPLPTLPVIAGGSPTPTDPLPSPTPTDTSAPPIGNGWNPSLPIGPPPPTDDSASAAAAGDPSPIAAPAP